MRIVFVWSVLRMLSVDPLFTIFYRGCFSALAVDDGTDAILKAPLWSHGLCESGTKSFSPVKSRVYISVCLCTTTANGLFVNNPTDSGGLQREPSAFSNLCWKLNKRRYKGILGPSREVFIRVGLLSATFDWQAVGWGHHAGFCNVIYSVTFQPGRHKLFWKWHVYGLIMFDMEILSCLIPLMSLA